MMEHANRLREVWNRTHPDYRGHIEGDRAILILIEGEGTCLVRLKDLTDDQIARKLGSGAR